ncbi:MAG: mycofactocin biosynthesis glycosyltransferase MftF [Micromonosporaceae bacterium]
MSHPIGFLRRAGSSSPRLRRPSRRAYGRVSRRPPPAGPAALPAPAAHPAPAALPAPAGLRLRRDPGLTSLNGGTVLLGGSPYRLIRLAPAAAAQVDSWWRGTPVPGNTPARMLARRLLDAGMAHPEPGEGPAASEVTVVIPVRDRVAELTRCLAGLAGAAGAGVIVVDDCSDDPGAVAAVTAAAGARYIRRSRSGGPAAARNTGLAEVATPFVAFLDSDCVPEPGWLTPLMRHFSDPAVAAVAPRIVPHEEGQRWLARYEGIRSALDMGPAESIVRPGAPVPYVPCAALVVRKEAAGGGFAEDMHVGEDVDFVWRLVAWGWHVRYEPRAAVAHQHRVHLREWFARRRDYGTSAAPLEQRHPGTVPAVTMSGWSAAAWLAAVAGCPGTGAAIVAGTTAVLARRLAPYTDGALPLAGRIAGAGTIAAGRLLGSALARTWWPIALPVAAAVPRLRLPLAALVVAPPLLDWRERRPAMDPVSYAAARLLDDVAYSVGVWQGCLERRTARPLAPRLWWWSRAGEPGGPRPRP